VGGDRLGRRASTRIARHLKETRDRCFVAKNARGEVVNRNPGMGLIGGCTDTNEFNFLQWKAGVSWGGGLPRHAGRV
jgi:formate dehydrogenase major subunit